MDENKFQFTLTALLRAVLLFAIALGSWVALFSNPQDVTPTVPVALLILSFGSVGAAVGTLAGRTMFGLKVGLLLVLLGLVFMAMVPSH